MGAEHAELMVQVRLGRDRVALLHRLLRTFAAGGVSEEAISSGPTPAALIAACAETRRALLDLEERLGALRPPGYQS
jgi:hypothetical protein